jgi:import inner membrane translocase subunit TIM16
MSLDEAVKILNLNDPSKKDNDQLRKHFDHLFKVNDQKTGGSFYLQSKVVRAKERVEMEWGVENPLQKSQDDNGDKMTASGEQEKR